MFYKWTYEVGDLAFACCLMKVQEYYMPRTGIRNAMITRSRIKGGDNKAFLPWPTFYRPSWRDEHP